MRRRDKEKEWAYEEVPWRSPEIGKRERHRIEIRDPHQSTQRLSHPAEDWVEPKGTVSCGQSKNGLVISRLSDEGDVLRLY